MRVFTYNKNNFDNIEDSITSILLDIYKYQYKLEHIIKKNNDYFVKLENKTILDESYYSFKIEGIDLNYNRLKEIIKKPNNFTLKNIFEKEALGYALFVKALNAKLESFEITTTSLLAMYKIIFEDHCLSNKGFYRKHNTQKMIVGDKIIEVDVSPVEAFETPLYTGSAIQSLNSSILDINLLNPLNIAKFNVDFMCIKPFDIGSGRLVRLFSLLCLYRSNIEICKYISISKIFFTNVEDYYKNINLACDNWSSNNNSYRHFIAYFLKNIKTAYCKIFENFKNTNSGKVTYKKNITKQDLIKKYISECTKYFKKSDILYNFPNISESTVETTLKKLLDIGYINKIGKNKGTKYELNKK